MHSSPPVGFLAAVAFVLLGAAPLAAPSPTRDTGALPLESPSDRDCYEWKYPKNDACGSLSGTSECLSEPTIDSAPDEDKRKACRPTKGDLCLCDD